MVDGRGREVLNWSMGMYARRGTIWSVPYLMLELYIFVLEEREMRRRLSNRES